MYSYQQADNGIARPRRSVSGRYQRWRRQKKRQGERRQDGGKARIALHETVSLLLAPLQLIDRDPFVGPIAVSLEIIFFALLKLI